MERRMTDGVLGQESWLIEEGIKSQELQWHKLKRKLKKEPETTATDSPNF